MNNFNQNPMHTNNYIIKKKDYLVPNYKLPAEHIRAQKTQGTQNYEDHIHKKYDSLNFTSHAHTNNYDSSKLYQGNFYSTKIQKPNQNFLSTKNSSNTRLHSHNDEERTKQINLKTNSYNSIIRSKSPQDHLFHRNTNSLYQNKNDRLTSQLPVSKYDFSMSEVISTPVISCQNNKMAYLAQNHSQYCLSKSGINNNLSSSFQVKSNLNQFGSNLTRQRYKNYSYHDQNPEFVNTEKYNLNNKKITQKIKYKNQKFCCQQNRQHCSKSTNHPNHYDYKDHSRANVISQQPQMSIPNSSNYQNNNKRFIKKKYEEPKLQGNLKIINQILAKNNKVINSNNQQKREQNEITDKRIVINMGYESTKTINPNRHNIKCSIKDFKIVKTIGEGKFGTVFMAIHKPTLAIYALKKIQKEIIKSHMLQNQLALQIRLQTYLNHPNILKLYGFFDDHQSIYLVLQFMDQGTLFQHLKKRTSRMTQKEVSSKIREITSAVKYLHENDIAHRDIKPENIVSSGGVSKLCDFGWATRCTDRRKTYCGTFDYAAPEILQGKQYDWCVDLWCLGVLTFQLLTGKVPFYHISRKETMKKILRVDRDLIVFPSEITWKARDFVQSLIKKDPLQRSRADELLCHPFIAEIKKQNSIF